MSVRKITSGNFESLKNETRTVLIDFYADWCSPCRTVSPIIDGIAAERSDIIVGKVNVDEEPALAQSFGVDSIPTLVVLKNGKTAKRAVGSRSKEDILGLL